MAPKPRDEDVRLMRFGAPPELELVDRWPGACRVHSSVLALCHDEPLAHANMSDLAAEAVVSALPPFWSYFLSSCQANQKIYASDLLLVE